MTKNLWKLLMNMQILQNVKIKQDIIERDQFLLLVVNFLLFLIIASISSLVILILEAYINQENMTSDC